MSVDRAISLRIITNLSYFSELVRILIKEGFSFGEEITSLSEHDVDDYNYIRFENIDSLLETLNKREDRGLNNYVVLRDKRVDERYLLSSEKLKSEYRNVSNHYRIIFSLGYGLRLKKAERFTDYSYYLEKILPILQNNSIGICEVACRDFDF